MHLALKAAFVAASLCLPQISHAQTTTTTTVTATCKDGTNFSGTSRRGACRGHGGVQAYGNDASPAPATTSQAPAPTRQSAPAAQQGSATPGGGAGQVWVNTASKVYHCQGDRWYGKTKKGEYMPEAQARSSGFHPDHNKVCAS